MEQIRKIPSVSAMLNSCLEESWAEGYSREQIVHAIRESLNDLRRILKAEGTKVPTQKELSEKIRIHLMQSVSYSLRRVVNATGVIVHTNLGRAPLANQAMEHVSDVAAHYSNLEFDLAQGMRGSREKHLEKFLLRILPAEASLVVNNNAAALLLILNTLADGKEVIVSRGELIEIGGSFRLPEIMKKSGAILKEVGTTNKTRIGDYRHALSDASGMILAVHPSNYRVIGFTEKPPLSALIELGSEAGIPVVEDHGSGILLNLESYGIHNEPEVKESVVEGADLICFSGDKILGGPQAGIICGKKKWIEALHKNPLFRALRVDKFVYAALEATLRLYLMEEQREIPVIRMLSLSQKELAEKAEAWLTDLIAKFPEHHWSCEKTLNFIGGGVAPMRELHSVAVSLAPTKMSIEEIARKLRNQDPAILARIEGDRLFFELRTLQEGEQDLVTSALAKILGKEVDSKK